MRCPQALLITAIVLAGCTVPPASEAPTQTGHGGAQPIQLDLFLKADHSLRTAGPAKASPDRVAANPMINGFANEDLRAFVSEPLPQSINITGIRVVAFYDVAMPTIDPFPNSSNPSQARQIVFWVGSDGIYPASVSTFGETVLVSGRTYRADALIPMPKPGWIVPKGERLQLLVATLAVNDRGAELRFLVDSADTPSRIEIQGMTDASAKPTTLHRIGKDVEILGNSGMFTGATGDRVPSRVRTPIEVRTNDTYLEVRVLFRSNAAAKSDLDFDLFAPNGQLAAVSSTPYQSESVRLFAPNIAWFGSGTYVADVIAYSGANTKFTIEARYDSPR